VADGLGKQSRGSCQPTPWMIQGSGQAVRADRAETLTGTSSRKKLESAFCSTKSHNSRFQSEPLKYVTGIKLTKIIVQLRQLNVIDLAQVQTDYFN
jgi:hypothetical protein